MSVRRILLKEAIEAIDSKELQFIKEVSEKGNFFRRRPEFKYNIWMPSKLSEEFWLITRTEKFMEFFGEWVDIKTNRSLLKENQCSKFVIDTEPQVFYHFSDNIFEKFKTPLEIEDDEDIEPSRYRDTGSYGIYFTENPKPAYKSFYGSNMYSCFLYGTNIKSISSSTYDIKYETIYDDDYEQLVRQGYDSLWGMGEAVVFEPDQIFITKRN